MHSISSIPEVGSSKILEIAKSKSFWSSEFIEGLSESVTDMTLDFNYYHILFLKKFNIFVQVRQDNPACYLVFSNKQNKHLTSRTQDVIEHKKRNISERYIIYPLVEYILRILHTK